MEIRRERPANVPAFTVRGAEYFRADGSDDALDGPLLLRQLVVMLLEQASPDGPQSVRASASIKIKHPERAIHVARPSADLRLVAPWTLSGTARRSGDSIDYDLEVAFERRRLSETSMRLTGLWRASSTATLDSRMTLGSLITAPRLPAAMLRRFGPEKCRRIL
jgi:hypothetical protein